jgi:uncharacterized protein (TIGR02646 family)
MGQPGPDLINYWRDFRDELADRFFDKCGYCEMRCRETDSPTKAPTLDHFRPRSEFPELTYEWSNWIYSCWRCNQEKGNLWPDSEYVDPCAVPFDERPEAYFEVDVVTGEVIAKSGLSEEGKRKAQSTIDDIGLNLLDLRYSRIGWVRQFQATLDVLPTSERQAFIDFSIGPEREFARITDMLLERLRQMGEL